MKHFTLESISPHSTPEKNVLNLQMLYFNILFQRRFLSAFRDPSFICTPSLELCFLSIHTYFCSHRTLNPVQITDLLHFFLRSTYFQYNGTIYKEREGVEMESPLVAVFANHQEKSLEEYVMTTSPFKSTIRKFVTSGWAVTCKPRDQLALVVSVWQGPIS